MYFIVSNSLWKLSISKGIVISLQISCHFLQNRVVGVHMYSDICRSWLSINLVFKFVIGFITVKSRKFNLLSVPSFTVKCMFTLFKYSLKLSVLLFHWKLWKYCLPNEYKKFLCCATHYCYIIYIHILIVVQINIIEVLP